MSLCGARDEQVCCECDEARGMSLQSSLHRLSMSRQGAPVQEDVSGDPIFVDFV